MPEGALVAAATHLPRLRNPGRKGTLGSPYAVHDHRAVNPELGTLDSLRAFVRTAHDLGMRVILDWVANHTAWAGTTQEHFGAGLHAVIVLSVVGEGIPLLYAGQEAGCDRRLALFEKDGIEWRGHLVGGLYHQLFALKHATPALWNAPDGARMVRLPVEAPALAFVRCHDAGDPAGSAVVAVVNWSDTARAVTLGDGPFAGAYTDAFSGETVGLAAGTPVDVAAWGWRVLVRHGPETSAATHAGEPANR